MIARDRLGKAHLYFNREPGRGVYWASEIKALPAAGCIDDSKINASALTGFMIYRGRDRGSTFWREVEDFPPGHYVWLDQSGAWDPVCYWRLPISRWKISDISAEQSFSGLADVLTGSLQLRMRADVPVAFELSGGMDSSALVSWAAGRLGKKFTTCTVAFPQAHSNEEPFARLVANRYPGQINYRVISSPLGEFWKEANDFVWLQEEPFHAPKFHTNQVLRRIFKEEGIGVVISGAAGDEMRTGYAGDYFRPYLRHLLARGRVRDFSHELFNNCEIPPYKRLVGLLVDMALSEEQRTILGKWLYGEHQLLKKVLPADVINTPLRLPSQGTGLSFHGRILDNMTHRRMNYWLRSGTKSNYVIPIEARAQFLDYRVVEYCCQLPPEYLIHADWHKYVLRKAVENYLPGEVVWRQHKMGFPFPEWLMASKTIALKNSQGVNCLYLNVDMLFQNYDEFVRVPPVTLWRLLSVMLWWWRVIEKQEICAS